MPDDTLVGCCAALTMMMELKSSCGGGFGRKEEVRRMIGLEGESIAEYVRRNLKGRGYYDGGIE